MSVQNYQLFGSENLRWCKHWGGALSGIWQWSTWGTRRTNGDLHLI